MKHCQKNSCISNIKIHITLGINDVNDIARTFLKLYIFILTWKDRLNAWSIVLGMAKECGNTKQTNDFCGNPY